MFFNWLITTRCNLKCCNLFKKDSIIDLDVDKLKNVLLIYRNDFHIFYGGEPTLHPRFYDILNFSKINKIPHTFITNGTASLDYSYEYESITISIEPTKQDKYRKEKTEKGIQLLKKVKSKEKVAEINIKHGDDKEYLKTLLKELNKINVKIIINFMDISKDSNYDFSSYYNDSIILRKWEAKEWIKIILENYNRVNILYLEYIDILLNILPSNYKCNNIINQNNWVIDPNGNFRLCLRIKGEQINTYNIFEDPYILNNTAFIKALKIDTSNLCKGCNWSCAIFADHQKGEVDGSGEDLEGANEKRSVFYA
ncbi:MAG: hypothetical protein KatS3mg002_0242 [Candidatus Woesearchaeota archaeon]|nr:MAG: hypothetical protein KatS3mg002_0242 [Candidatus Woesearchaeota archaeon]